MPRAEPEAPPAPSPLPEGFRATPQEAPGPAPQSRTSADTSGWVPIPNAGRSRLLDDATAGRIPDPTPAASPEVAAPARPDPAADDRIEPIRHVVQPLENFWTISRLYYASGRYYKALWAANRDRVEQIDRLYVGTTILVPPPEDLDPSLIDPPSASARPGAAADRRPAPSDVGAARARRAVEPEEVLSLPPGRPDPPRAAPPAAPAEPDYPVYQVQAGDTLRTIARRTLDDPHRADEILDLNREAIPDPLHLRVGQRLYLPEDAHHRRDR